MTGFPRPATSFVGREQDVATVAALIRRDDVQLVSLTGPGGVGKTQLALRVAEQIAGTFADGVVSIPLDGVDDPELVAGAIARALSLAATDETSLLDRMADHLHNRQLLLVIDTFEHVMSAAPLLVDLLAAAPSVKMLVTTRVMLRLSGERVVLIHPLPADSDAVRLFVERAKAANPGFAPTAEEALMIAEICDRLDGLPLAIELAVAHLRDVPLETLLSRLEQRLSLLTTGTGDAPARHRTMRAAVAWSYDLLIPADKVLCRRLSVFADGFTLEDAEAVSREFGVVDSISRLVESSVINRVSKSGEPPRYAMLETVREFGLEQLAASGEEADVRAVLDRPRPEGESDLPLDRANAGATMVSDDTKPAVDATIGLTPRQLDVLRLMVEGLSDTEIAWRLRISARTASNHVAAVLAKLGVHSRQAAATEAARRNLL